MIAIRRARARDAPGIAAVHVATWRSAYAGLLPDDFLEHLSAIRLAGQYDRSIRMGLGMHVAIDSQRALIPCWWASPRPAAAAATGWARAKWKLCMCWMTGRIRALAARCCAPPGKFLASLGCRSAYAWVLRENPAGFFYQRLGGKCIATR